MNQSRQSGFTLVELMLAMAFVSALLLAIAMTVIQIGNIYNRGLTYKSVNEAGSTIASELQRGINGSSQFDISTDADGNGINYVTKTWGGRLCLGQYSYIWNYGKIVPDASVTKNTYSGADSADEIRFIKVLDSNKSYCGNPQPTINKAYAVELLNAGQSDLAIHNFTITADNSAYDSKTGQRLYSIGFLIGTNDQNALTGSSGGMTCSTPDDVNSDPSYCAVNQFDIVVRAGNSAQ